MVMISYANYPGKAYLKPAENYAHLHAHCPEMYPLYPYELYGLCLPELNVMKQTSLATGKHRFEVTAWKQGNIHAAMLGDTALARELNVKKMDNGPYRFPAFWDATIDWTPDHNWGGIWYDRHAGDADGRMAEKSAFCRPGHKTGTWTSNCMRPTKPQLKARFNRTK